MSDFVFLERFMIFVIVVSLRKIFLFKKKNVICILYLYKINEICV